MNIAVKKVEIIEWLAQLNDEQLINKVEKLKKQSIKVSYESRLKPMTAKAYKAMLEQAENDYKEGRVIGQERLEQESEVW
jgi:short subunit dehydrogenase-like uncharacterized protein